MDRSAIKSVKIEAEGSIGDYLESLSTFATVGALTTALSSEKINYVNATFVAEEKGIKLSYEQKPNKSGYNNKVTVTITTNNGVNSVSGTIFNDDVQRIIEVNNFNMDIEPSGKMILLTNSDVPGVIGEVGKTLGDHGINIADFRLGRNDSGALAVIIVDSEIDDETMTQLENLEAATSVCFVKI
jgi:D-3-phosphoglycerate dehydrogenase